jgi:general secretion pathway protein E/type IV pilus assembly protein PilB
MGGMNIADRLNPQDGRFTLEIGNRKVDFRASSLPTIHGENVVLRILDKSQALVTIDKLGYTPHNFALIKLMVQKPEGIIIVTGPTGSGKTTTLYAIMAFINSLDVNIMTLEDPVEYELALIRQAQVREGSSLSFSEGIRTLLRQDPDIILVGEVRDSGTATMALRAAMTGHQVYTTLHTNDAAGCIPRLLDLGLKPNLMAGNVIGIIAQRLVRKLCDECKVMKPATPEECQLLGVDAANPPTIAHPKGCDNCRKTGYRGRIAASEILPFNEEVDALIIQDAPLTEVKQAARKSGFVPMLDDATTKVLEGKTSIKAAMNVVDFTSRLKAVG